MSKEMAKNGTGLEDGIIYVGIRTIQDILSHCIQNLSNKHILCYVGEPGLGKTQIAEQVFRSLNMPLLCPPPLSVQDPSDLRGVPVPNKKTRRTDWFKPSWLPSEKDWKGGIFLDEFFQGDYDVIKPYGQFILSGRLDEYTLPEGARFVIASNRRSDAAGVSRIPTPVLNRLCMVGMHPDVDAWSSYAAGLRYEGCGHKAKPEVRRDGSLNPIVRSYFTQFKRDHFNTFDATKQTPFSSGRSIERLSEFIDSDPPEHIVLPCVAGYVGVGVGSEFCGYLKVYREVPSFEDVVNNPLEYPMPKNNPALECALASAAASYVTRLVPEEKMPAKKDSEDRFEVDSKKMSQIITYISRLPSEYASFFLHLVCQHRTSAFNTKGYNEHFRKAHSERIRAAYEIGAK